MRTLPRISTAARFAVLVLVALASGCASVGKQPSCLETPGGDAGKEPAAAAKDDDKDKEPKTLFEWRVPGKRGAADVLADGPKPDEDDDWIQADRPDFTETSNTIGKGRVQVESGYTFTRDGSGAVTLNSHSYPEIHLRLGMFAEWFEWRIDQNFNSLRQTQAGVPKPIQSVSGATDFLLGAKFALTEQKKVLPEMAIIFQTTAPVGSRAFTSGKVLPGISYQYGWNLSERYTLAGSFVGNAAVDDDDHSYVQLANSLSLGVNWTKKFGSYFEYIGFYPAGATSAGFGPQYYVDSGFQYKLNKNFQVDIRAGLGLNRVASDYFVGSGFAARY